MRRKILCSISAFFAFLAGSFLMCSTTFAVPGSDQWYWLTSDDNYSKYYDMSGIKVEQSFGNVAVKISAIIRTDYSPGGALDTIRNYKLDDLIDPMDLKCSIAEVEINPQNRTLAYRSETFYDADDRVLWQKDYNPLKPKEINSQEFDEIFYTNIVDNVMHGGEEKRRQAADRWLSLWRKTSDIGGTMKAMADTSTMRLKGDNVIFWEWEETRSQEGKVTRILFQKKAFDIVRDRYKITQSKQWTRQNGWQDLTHYIDGMYHAIESDSTEYDALQIVKLYEGTHRQWMNRYSLDRDK